MLLCVPTDLCNSFVKLIHKVVHSILHRLLIPWIGALNSTSQQIGLAVVFFWSVTEFQEVEFLEEVFSLKIDSSLRTSCLCSESSSCSICRKKAKGKFFNQIFLLSVRISWKYHLIISLNLTESTSIYQQITNNQFC